MSAGAERGHRWDAKPFWLHAGEAAFFHLLYVSDKRSRIVKMFAFLGIKTEYVLDICASKAGKSLEGLIE